MWTLKGLDGKHARGDATNTLHNRRIVKFNIIIIISFKSSHRHTNHTLRNSSVRIADR